MESNSGVTTVVDLSKFGPILGNRATAAKLRQDALADIGSGNKIVFDLASVESVSSGFCFELFGELYKQLQNDFGKSVSFRFSNSPNTHVIRTLVNNSLQAAVTQIRGVG